MTVLVFLVSLLGAMALGMPIAISLLVCGVALMLHLGMFDAQILAQNLIGGAEVDWSDSRGMTPLTEGARYTPPSGLLSPGRSLVMVEVTYLYESAFAEIGVGRFAIEETFCLRPRRSLVVSRQ